MQFMDDSLLPENQDPLVIQVAPYAPSFLPARLPTTSRCRWRSRSRRRSIATMPARRVLHVHVREPDGKGSKRLECSTRCSIVCATAVPKMILQVGGSISFAPEG